MQGIQLTTGMADGFYNHSNENETGYYFGAAISTCTIGSNKWVFGGEYLQKYNPYKDSRIPTMQFTADGGYYIHVSFTMPTRRSSFTLAARLLLVMKP